ncbi:hypothetical protein L0Y65_06890 [Candidatus Micrarchaeota archaeon]|nr:hypothetical protein [Candidatus Micrarchaeota archaeon]
MKLRHDNVSGIGKEGCKDSAAGAAERSRISRLREIAAAGAIGFALFFSSGVARAQNGPDGGVPPRPDAAATAVADAGSEETAPASAPASARAPVAHTLQALPQAMSISIDSSSHPSNASAPDILTTNLLRMFRLRDLVRNPPAAPAEGQQATPERMAYDAAISAWSGAGTAATSIDAAIARAMRTLGRTAQTRESMGSDAAALEAKLTELDASIGAAGGTSYTLEAAGNTVACLLRMMRGGEVCTESAAPRPEDRATLAPALPPIEAIPDYFGSEFMLSGFGQGRFVMADPASTPALNSMFGGSGIAQGALNTWKDALEVLTNSPNDPAAQASAAHALHSALSQIPQDKEIWTRPGFNSAMVALNQGDLRGGLAALRSEPAFNAVWSTLGNLNQITLSQRAIARIRTGFQLRFPDGTNPQEFLSFRRGTEDRAYPWDVLYYHVGANYTNLLMSARLQAYSLDINTFSLTPSGPAVSVSGDGHAVDGMAGITFGGTMFRQPVEATLSARLGYLWWAIQAPDQQQRMLSVNDGTMYGMLDFNAAMVGYEGRTNAFRLSRWGLGIFNLNPYVNFTLTGRSFEGNNLRLEHSITPRYMLFWGRRQEGLENPLFFQNRVGADVRPLDFTIQQSSGLTWHAGPALSYNWNTEQGIHSFEPYAYGSLRWAAGGLGIDARVGYIAEAGGPEAYRAPSTVTGMLNLILTPAAWFSGGSGANTIRIDSGTGTGRGGNK